MSSHDIRPEEILDRLEHLEDTVADQQATIDRQASRLDEQDALIQAQSAQIETLKATIAGEDEVETFTVWREENDSLAAQLDDVRGDLGETERQLHRQRAKLTRRVALLEDDVGLEDTDIATLAEGGDESHGLTDLGRLKRLGPEGVRKRPTTRLYLAEHIVNNWSRWGAVNNAGTERRLASVAHDLETRLEDAWGEPLDWRQVYRAMEEVADLGGDRISLEEGDRNEGKYVLVHQLADGGDR